MLRCTVTSAAAPAVKKIIEASRSRILARVAAAVPGSPAFVVNDSAARPTFEAVTPDNDVAREVKALWASVETIAGRKAAPLSDIPTTFAQNPRTDYAAYKKMALALRADTPLSTLWLTAIERAEAYEKETDQVDPAFEDALVNALIPLQRSYVDALASANRMAATSQKRIAELEKELAKVESDIASIDNLNVAAIAKEHPDWEADAQRRVDSHDWNMVADEVDKDDHSAHHAADAHGKDHAKAH